jgi:hypothetical protein
MKSRTTNENADDFKDYGGRGIKVCIEWADNYQAFHDWAMASDYAENLTIDRKDNDGDYTPDNCRWVTITEQANNRRNNSQIEHNGEAHTLREWARLTGIKYPTLQDRLKRGWSARKTLTTPINERMSRK